MVCWRKPHCSSSLLDTFCALQVTGEHNEDCKKLLRLMGVPVIDAPSEAEAQCAAMAKAGVVYGAATEDMDCLTFGCPRLIRHLMASQVCGCAGTFPAFLCCAGNFVAPGSHLYPLCWGHLQPLTNSSQPV